MHVTSIWTMQVMKELLKDYFPSSKFRPIIIHDPAQMSSSTLELQWPRDKGWEVFSDRTPCEVNEYQLAVVLIS